MNRRTLVITVFALAAAGPPAFAQAPFIQSVQNTASNVALTSIAPQVLVTIKGQHLSASTQAANGFPLPTALGGATVTFTGPNGPLLAPLFYASPTQINAEAPGEIQGANIIVTTAAGSSAPLNVPTVAGTYPYLIGPLGIFTQDTSGCGQAVAYNVHPDGSVTLNTPQTSLDPQKDVGLTLFLTGLGSLDFTDRQTGVPWTYYSADNLAPQLASSVTFGAPGLTATATDLSLTYLGPAPGKVGIDQANALGQWQGGPQGCKVPLSLALLEPQVNSDVNNSPVAATSVPFTSTQVVDVSIQPGGGACADPPESTLGILTWQKNIVGDFTGSSSSEAVTAQFIQSEGLGLPQPPVGAPFPPLPYPSGNPNNASYGAVAAPAPACNTSLPNTLDAGPLTVTGPGISRTPLQPSTQDGRLTYSAAFPPGTLQGGTYRVAGQGGSQVGGFTASADIPAPIANIVVQVPSGGTTSLAPGTQLETPCENISTHPIVPCGGTYYFTWTGGDDRSYVTVQFIVGSTFLAAATAYAGTGQIEIPESYGAYPLLCGTALGAACTLMPSGNVEVIFTQTPYQAPSQPFNAPGLGLGGESTWNYVWDFRGLAN